MPILLRRGGTWVVNENIYAYPTKPTGSPRRVVAAYLYQSTLPDPPVTAPNQKAAPTSVKHKLFDLTVPPPTGLVGTSPPSTDPNHHTKAILTWNAVPKAIGYRVYKYDPATGPPTSTTTYNTSGTGPISTTTIRYPAGSAIVTPSPATATTYTFTGLPVQPPFSTVNFNAFQFYVTSISPVGIESSPSNIVTLKNGKPAVVAQNTNYPANPTLPVALAATSGDTWQAGTFWASHSGVVMQGYLSSAYNRAYGVINYGNGYTSTAALLETMYQKLFGAGIGKAILDHLVTTTDKTTVVDAKFKAARQTAGCLAGNNVYLYPATWAYASNARPVAVGTSAYFDAPGPGVTKSNFRTIDGDGDNSHLILWAGNMARKTQVHNGLMMYRSDTTNTSGDGYAGYAVFSSSTSTNSYWDIDIWFKFHFTFKPYIGPVWS